MRSRILRFAPALRFEPALLLALLTAFAVSTPADSQDAATPAYNIELIVFRPTTAQGGAENWSAESAASESSVAGAENGSSSSQVGHFVSTLPPSQFQLTEIESKLRASGA